MKRFSRVLCVTDLDGSAGSVLDIAARVATYARSRELKFLHVVAPMELPKEMVQRYPWLAEPISQVARDRLETGIAEVRKNHPDVPIDSEIREGAEILETLRVAVAMEADLIVVPRKHDEDQRGIRLSRKAPCSVMTIPNSFSGELAPVLVPVDLSEHSRRAVDVAGAFAEAQDLPELHTLYAYTLPPGSHKAAIPEEQLRQDIEAHCQQELDDFVTESLIHDRKTVNKVTPVVPVGAAIRMRAKEIGAGLIVAGSRGRDVFAALLLGSTAEDLLKTSPVPVVTVKEKGSGQNLLQALLQT